MRLDDARLCLDCDEVHDRQQCPHCASERFSYLSRWVPLPDERKRPRQQSSPKAEVYRQLIEPAPPKPARGTRLFRHGMLGVTAVGVLGWLWQSAARARDASDDDTSDQPPATPPRTIAPPPRESMEPPPRKRERRRRR
jgi:hypothetical protein